MKRTLQLLLCFCILQLSCTNDDDNDIQEMEININENLVDSTVSLSPFSDVMTLDLETGTILNTSNESLFATIGYQNSFIGILDNRIVRSTTTDFTGTPVWEIFPTEGNDLELELFNAKLAINGNTLYVTLIVTDPDTTDQFHTIAAINAENGTVLWSENQLDTGLRQVVTLNNTIITLDGEQGDAILSSRNPEDGSIINQWTLGERVSHLIAGENEVIVMSWDNAIYSINEDLSLNWSFTTDGANVRRGMLIGNQFLFHSRDENIYAINLQFGDLNWSQNLSDLVIENFFGDSNTLWSVTRDFTNDILVVNELDVNNGTIFSTFTIPITNENSNDLELVNFDDYLFIITSQDSDEVTTQLVNFISQEVVWQNALPLSNISIFNANILLGESRFARSSFFGHN